MKDHIVIEHGKISDLKKVKEITARAYKDPYKEGSVVTEYNEDLDELKESFRKKDFFFLVAVWSGGCAEKILGSLRYKILDSGDVYLFKLAVLKTARNMGIAAELMKKIEKVAKRKKAKKIFLDCMQEKLIYKYYESLGYKVDKIKKHLDHHEVYMSKEL